LENGPDVVGEYQRALATGDSGKLAAARVYDDSDPPLSARAWRPAAA
jgi:hypothetical protein